MVSLCSLCIFSFSILLSLFPRVFFLYSLCILSLFCFFFFYFNFFLSLCFHPSFKFFSIIFFLLYFHFLINLLLFPLPFCSLPASFLVFLIGVTSSQSSFRSLPLPLFFFSSVFLFPQAQLLPQERFLQHFENS